MIVAMSMDPPVYGCDRQQAKWLESITAREHLRDSFDSTDDSRGEVGL
jgi:hypothetical protein